MTMLFGMTVLANETETPENEEIIEEETYYVYDRDFGGNFTMYYKDGANVWHTVVANASCVASYGWNEGYSGWIDSVYFYTISATIDGQACTISQETQSVYTSFAERKYYVNGSASYIRIYLSIDEYGNATFGGDFHYAN